jgi:plastocyanin
MSMKATAIIGAMRDAPGPDAVRFAGRRYPLRVLWSLAVVLVAEAAIAGTINGRVDLMEKGGQRGDASEVVVYLEGVKAKAKPETATVVMKGKQFIPHVLVIPVGSSVTFPNEDPIFHNAFSVSGENRFDLELYKRPKAASWTFQHPGVVRVYCNIHPQMSATVLVVENGFYVRPEKDGTFSFADVPAGDYALRAWHERGGEAALDVKVTAAGTTNAHVALDTSKYKRVPHKNKLGKDYSTSETY